MDIIEIIFGGISVIGTGVSIYGAIISSRESKKAQKYLDEINAKKSALDLGVLCTRTDNLHKDIYNTMLARRATRGARKEFDTYRKWCDEITLILNAMPIDMVTSISNFEEVKGIINSCILDERSMHDIELGDGSSFQKVESIIYNTNKEIKNRINEL